MLTNETASVSEDLLADSYLLNSILYADPEQMDKKSTDERISTLCEALREAGAHKVAAKFSEFQKKLWKITSDEHMFALEMTPTSPPYLGHYGFDAPKSCGEIGVSERNIYMIEIAAVYKHYGMVMEHGEMPDYVPAVNEFLAISLVEKHPDSRILRRGYIDSLVSPFLPKLKKGFKGKPWALLIEATELLIELEVNDKIRGDE